jgi:hypothetical protein
MPDLASTSPYIRASEKFPKLKQQAAERLEKRPDQSIKPDSPATSKKP